MLKCSRILGGNLKNATRHYSGLIVVSFHGRVSCSAYCIVEVFGLATQEWPSRVAEEAARGNFNPANALVLLLLQAGMYIIPP